MNTRIIIISACALSFLALAHADDALPITATFGPNPVLPKPHHPLIPTVNIAEAKGWAAGALPTAAAGFAVNSFGAGLDHPRTIFVLPNGDVLVTETSAPANRPEETEKLKGKIMAYEMKKAGSAVPSANRITLLRDADGDGTAETRTIFLAGLNSPFGMTLVGDQLYVANTDALLKFPYKPGDTEISANPVKVMDLPAGPMNHHWTKTVVANADGSKLYVSVGSNSNAAEGGMEKEQGRACIYELELASGRSRVFASGLRNAAGLAWHPESGLWAAVNERDEIGDDLVPDYMTAVKDGAFYGWPYSYFGQNIDERVKPQNVELVAKALKPDYALGAHTASLGLTFYSSSLFPEKFLRGAFVGQHGSWNRKPASGYKVIFVPFKNGKPSGPPEDLLTGFLSSKGDALGRPVGVAVDKKGALLVADDVGDTIWRVIPSTVTK